MTSKRRRLNLYIPTPAEDRIINAGIAADPDTYELSDAEFRELRPFRGRPPALVRKVAVSIRLDPDVVTSLRAIGPGWQTRINEVLRAYVKRRARATRA
jgi:uncharacterized protein (DUF4415 family)